jgi:short-subunit dehydrogenase
MLMRKRRSDARSDRAADSATESHETRVAIVTGAASGIGLGLAHALAARGCHVSVIDLNEEAAEGVAAELRAKGVEATVHAVDVRDRSAMERAIADTVAQYGRLDYLVNNVGYFVEGPLQDRTLNEVDRFVDINVRGVLNGVLAAYPVMLQQRSGNIINIASISGLVPAPGSTLYGMTKHAIVGLSLSLLAEASASGIHVCVACPGFIETPLTKDATPQQRKLMYRPDQLAHDILTAVDRRRAIVVEPAWAKFTWYFYRLFPKRGNAMAANISRKVHTKS